MTQKRKSNQSKLDTAESLLRKLEEQTARDVKRRLGDNWRDNLFEVMMTRLELAAPEKKIYAAIPSELIKQPSETPRFAKIFTKTMHNMLKLAKAPAQPHHIAVFSILYATVIDTFLKDPTKDNAKTMAAVDQRLGVFERFIEYTECR